MSVVLMEPSRFPRAGIMGSSEQPDMDAGNCGSSESTWVL